MSLQNPIVVAYGGGVNSTAMLVEMRRRNIVPSLILFADTGGERPEVYAGVQTVSKWCVGNAFPGVIVVKESITLEQDCIDRRALPSIAYGFKSCSERFKQRPQNRFVKAWVAKGQTCVKAIGFDAGESRRVKPSGDPVCENWFPLIEWNLFREDCAEICKQADLPAVKSSCFFCPAMKKREILALQKENPELAARAVAMEKNADLTTIKGLGRNFAWGDLLRNDEAQMKLFSDAGTPEIACGCYDG